MSTEEWTGSEMAAGWASEFKSSRPGRCSWRVMAASKERKAETQIAQKNSKQLVSPHNTPPQQHSLSSWLLQVTVCREQNRSSMDWCLVITDDLIRCGGLTASSLVTTLQNLTWCLYWSRFFIHRNMDGRQAQQFRPSNTQMFLPSAAREFCPSSAHEFRPVASTSSSLKKGMRFELIPPCLTSHLCWSPSPLLVSVPSSRIWIADRFLPAKIRCNLVRFVSHFRKFESVELCGSRFWCVSRSFFVSKLVLIEFLCTGARVVLLDCFSFTVRVSALLASCRF
jgi:hypothetical protein